MKMRCVARCPELDYDESAHCVEDENGIMHECYREYGCCKAGNVPIWEEIRDRMPEKEKV